MPTINNIKDLDIVERNGEPHLKILTDETKPDSIPSARSWYIPMDEAKHVAGFVEKESLRRMFE